MTRQTPHVPGNLVTIGAQALLDQSPLLSKFAAQADAALVLGAVLAHLRERVAEGPHDYECSLFPPVWAKPDTDTGLRECDCTNSAVLTLLETGRYSDRIEEWVAERKSEVRQP